MFVTRFAPSPTGYLHLGHAYSALLAYDRAQAEGGTFLLRLEDIDSTRCRDDFARGIVDDLSWLGISWPEPVWRQSDRSEAYQAALNRLRDQGLIYPCFCTRKDIAAEIAASSRAPHGPDGPIYPGTCRPLSDRERRARLAAGEDAAWRLDVSAAMVRTGPIRWTDELAREIDADPASLGDLVLARKDIATSYHLSVVVDDAAQEVSHVIRGQDLFHATHIHRLLQALLELPVPRYHHHPLILGDDGKRLAKRDRSMTLRALRQGGATPQDIRSRLKPVR